MNILSANVLPVGFQVDTAHNVATAEMKGYTIAISGLEMPGGFRIQNRVVPQNQDDAIGMSNHLATLMEIYPFVKYAGMENETITIDVISDPGDEQSDLTILLNNLLDHCQTFHMQNDVMAAQDQAMYRQNVNTQDAYNQNAYGQNPYGQNAYAQQGQPAQQSKKGFTTIELNTGKPERFVLGMIGAVLGAVICSILWIVLGQIGFIAGIAGYLIVFGSVLGYQKLGGNISKKGLVMCVVASVIVILLAELCSLGISIYQVNVDYYIGLTPWFAMTWIPEYLQDSEVLASLVKTLAIGYAFAVWGSYSFVRKLWKQIP